MIAGGLVGSNNCKVPATHPFDVIKTNMMAFNGPHAGVKGGMVGMGHAILRAEGVRALFKGMGTRLARVSSEQAFTFMLYGQISSLLDEWW